MMRETLLLQNQRIGKNDAKIQNCWQTPVAVQQPFEIIVNKNTFTQKLLFVSAMYAIHMFGLEDFTYSQNKD